MTRAYSIKFLIATLAVFLGIGLINRIVDPYGIWGSPQIQGINNSKYSVFHERIPNYVAWSKWSNPPETILLGTSRTAGGLRSDHPALQNGSTTLNMALGGQPAPESLLLFKHALKTGKLKRVVIGLDFFAFNVYWAADSASQEKRLTPGLNLDLYFNSSTFSDSLTTLRQSWPGLRLVNEAHGAEPVTGNGDPAAGMPMRVLFMAVEKIYVDYYHPPPFRIYSHTTPDKSRDTLKDFRELLRLAHANNIELHLLISPSHAWHWEALADMGLWQEWEQWKRSLVAINTEEAARTGQPGYPLWDFSGYNSITTENVPSAGQANKMAWYDDSSHYNHACGDLILDRLFARSDSASPAHADFGTLLDAKNIDIHLSDVRQARQSYQASHPADVQEMADFIKQFWNH